MNLKMDKELTLEEGTLKQAAENIAQSITNPEEKLTSSLYKYNGSISLI